MADGLPSNVVYDIYEDSKGFMWFCTDQGISRYDGSAFHNYSIKDGVPDREVFRIREDNQQRYWLVCYNRKACYLKHGKIYTSENDALCRKIEAEDIAYDELFTDRDGNECLVGKKIGVLRPGPPYLKILDHVTLPAGRLRHFRINGDDCIMTTNGLYNINTNALQKMGYAAVSFYDGHSLFVSAFTSTEKGQELHQWQLRGDSLYLVKEIKVPGRLYQAGPLEKNGMKLCTSEGILAYDSLSKKIIPDPGFPAGVPTNNMRVDKKGNQWISTLNDGVYFVPVNGGRIIDQRSGLLKSNILSISLSSEGDILAGDDDGHVYRIKKNNTIQIYTLTPRLPDNRVLFVRDNGQGLLIVGSDAGLFTIEGEHVSAIRVSISMKAGVFSENHFYAGFSAGFLVYNSHTRKAGYYEMGRITALALDGKHILWTGGIEGLNYYTDGQAQKYNLDTLLASSRITCMATAPGGGILAGSITQGLFVIKSPEQPPLHLDKLKGLSGNSCKQIFVSENGCIWLCSDGGIDRIIQTEDGDFMIKPFPLPSGLTGNQINDLAESDGRLYLATSGGILALNSEGMLPFDPPRLYIESVNGNAFTGQSLRFRYKERNLQIMYTGLSYTGGSPIEYKYILAGSLDDTLYTNEQAINFSALSPGDYKLLLWCRSPASDWTASPVQLSFTILAPFWRHPVSIAVLLLLAGAAVIAIFRFRINKVKKRVAQEARNQQQLAELEMNALRAQINPHFIFNALNAIQFYYSQNDEITANHYMSSFAHFIRLTLAHSQTHWLPLSEEIAMLRIYLELEQIRFQHLFTVTINVMPGLTVEQVAIPAMLIQPYVENAINHGLRYLKERQGELILSFSMKQDNLCIIIDDNGIGRTQASTYKQSQHASFGMKITHQRIEAINRMYGIIVLVDIIDKPETGDKPGGTQVSLLIPLELIDHDSDYTNR
ncbi:sensor histidine kinase [Taibaiella sp. KBW10]|uniref:sensor histidine kinase n=1 Tax=Taibaiella sp. KBW10 TaxID=2153357 RepID=UPI00131548CD|nr:sensor histidine kinase [Taibaiella sp. KBW10]